MCIRKCFSGVLTALPFLLLSYFSASQTTSDLDRFCELEYNDSLICYVTCFEGILDLLPKETDLTRITGLVVRQTNPYCDTDLAVEVFNRFTNLRELHFTGVACPFSKLPSITNLNQLIIMPTQDNHKDKEQISWRPSKQTILPKMDKLVVKELCCDLFQGNVLAPRLEDLSFQCARVPSYITGSNETKNSLFFTVPHLKKLEYTENGLGFPVSSVANLPELSTLFVTPNTEFSESFLPVKTPLNLSGLKEITFMLEDHGPFASASHYFQCVDLGNTNLTHITLINPSVGPLTCPALWRCASCHPHTSNDIQTVDIYIQSTSFTKLSSLLPKLSLNTTDLSLNHYPLLHIDGDAMGRFSHLRSLQVGETYGGRKHTGMVIFLDNPFKSLKRPDKFCFIRLSLVECGCLVYNAFAWLKEQNPHFDGKIQCAEVLQTSSPEERIEVGQWIHVSEFLKRLQQRCQPIQTSTNYLPTANRFVMQSTTEESTDNGKLRKASLLTCAILFLFSAILERIND
ncbi:unnamed protein product [Hymenolepis diminuta]|uniref:LRRCT domain-containing protein n=1 Tax=Hymenolepis diminuta TaxID=6216 RepID=A0A0R3SJ12_HYMDI|nr:unnamed protein product [Hymenolepis diminuta]VUZ51586.1 unnamed protein product [Hymenolepis diminuta]